MLNLGICMLLISYAADMMSLFISSISRTTTAAMTVMPFVLIFQLVFSGSVFPLPARVQPLSNFTISNYGIRAIAAECGYNDLPMAAGWNAHRLHHKHTDHRLGNAQHKLVDQMRGHIGCDMHA